MPNSQPINTIVLSTKPQLDAIAAVLLLLLFGENNYPSIRKAKMEFRKSLPPEKTASGLESQGILIIDLPGNKFQRNNGSIAIQVANELGVNKEPALEKLLAFIERDLTQSAEYKDAINQTFNLAELTKDLIQEYADNPQRIIDVVMPLLLAHYHSEKKRIKTPVQPGAVVKKEEAISSFDVFQGKKLIRVITLKKDVGLTCQFLTNNDEIKADVILQQQSSGQINIITNPERAVNLHDTIVMLRISEARIKNAILEISSIEELAKPNTLQGVEEWHYDSSGNCIKSEGAKITKLAFAKIEEILKVSLSSNTLSDLCPKDKCLEENCDFFDYHFERCHPYQN